MFKKTYTFMYIRHTTILWSTYGGFGGGGSDGVGCGRSSAKYNQRVSFKLDVNAISNRISEFYLPLFCVLSLRRMKLYQCFIGYYVHDRRWKSLSTTLVRVRSINNYYFTRPVNISRNKNTLLHQHSILNA